MVVEIPNSMKSAVWAILVLSLALPAYGRGNDQVVVDGAAAPVFQTTSQSSVSSLEKSEQDISKDFQIVFGIKAKAKSHDSDETQKAESER